MAKEGEIITAQSTPDYDNFGIDTYWTCTDWIIWFDKLKDEHGRVEARLIWRSAWEKQDVAESNFVWCGFDEIFRKFLSKNKLGASSVFHDIGVGLGDTAGGVAGGLGWVGRNVKWILPIGIAIYGGYFVLKTVQMFKEVSK